MVRPITVPGHLLLLVQTRDSPVEMPRHQILLCLDQVACPSASKEDARNETATLFLKQPANQPTVPEARHPSSNCSAQTCPVARLNQGPVHAMFCHPAGSHIPGILVSSRCVFSPVPVLRSTDGGIYLSTDFEPWFLV